MVRDAEPCWRIEVGEDDDLLRERLTRALRERGHMVMALSNRADALAAIRSVIFDAAVIDVDLDGGSGLDIAGELLSAQPKVRVVMATGLPTAAHKAEAIRLGAIGVVSKPFEPR